MFRWRRSISCPQCQGQGVTHPNDTEAGSTAGDPCHCCNGRGRLPVSRSHPGRHRA